MEPPKEAIVLTDAEYRQIMRRREERERQARYAKLRYERDQAKRERLRTRLFRTDGTWETRDGTVLDIMKDMTPSHAANALRVAMAMHTEYMLLRPQVDVSGWESGEVEVPPTIKLLRERSMMEPSWRDKRADKKNRSNFEKKRARARARY